MAEWVSIALSVALPVIGGVCGWFINRLTARIDDMDKSQTQAAQKQTQITARLQALEKTSLTRDDLRDVVEKALQRAINPITVELRAISANGQQTRERLVRLEATYDAARDGSS